MWGNVPCGIFEVLWASFLLLSAFCELKLQPFTQAEGSWVLTPSEVWIEMGGVRLSHQWIRVKLLFLWLNTLNLLNFEPSNTCDWFPSQESQDSLHLIKSYQCGLLALVHFLISGNGILPARSCCDSRAPRGGALCTALVWALWGSGVLLYHILLLLSPPSRWRVRMSAHTYAHTLPRPELEKFWGGARPSC